MRNNLKKIGLTLIGINVICEVPFYKQKIRDSWLKYEHEIKKMIIYVNLMLICVNITNRHTDRQTHQKYSSEPHNNIFLKI